MTAGHHRHNNCTAQHTVKTLSQPTLIVRSATPESALAAAREFFTPACARARETRRNTINIQNTYAVGGCLAEVVLRVDIGLCLEEQIDDRDMAAVCCVVEG